MPLIEKVLSEMQGYMEEVRKRRESETQLRRKDFTSDEPYERQRARLKKEIEELENDMASLLRFLEREPDRLYRTHSLNLQAFNADGGGSYDDFVFIMTKFPDKTDEKPGREQLEKVIEILKNQVIARKYKPRIASEKAYARWLFGNVELFLFGCARGIAIVEDKYLPELNPNVAIEWGWMTGMGRGVLYLREQSFSHKRADWDGLINYAFDWNDPEPGIEIALDAFLPARP